MLTPFLCCRHCNLSFPTWDDLAEHAIVHAIDNDDDNANDDNDDDNEGIDRE